MPRGVRAGAFFQAPQQLLLIQHPAHLDCIAETIARAGVPMPLQASKASTAGSSRPFAQSLEW